MARDVGNQVKTEVLYVKLPSGRGFLALNNLGTLIPLTSLKEGDFVIGASIYSLDGADLPEKTDLITSAVGYAKRYRLQELFFEAMGNTSPKPDLSNLLIH